VARLDSEHASSRSWREFPKRSAYLASWSRSAMRRRAL